MRIICNFCILVILLGSICCGCVSISYKSDTKNETEIKTLIEENENSIIDSRLSLVKTGGRNQPMIKAEIKYSPDNVLLLDFYSEYDAHDVIYKIYIKSSMCDNETYIQRYVMSPDYVEVKMYDYKTINLILHNGYVGEELICSFDIEEFIDSDLYPNEHNIIVANRPELPDLDETFKIVIEENEEYFVCNEYNSNKIINELQKITSNDLVTDIEDKLLSEKRDNVPYVIYAVSEDTVFKYVPVENKGYIIIDGARYYYNSDSLNKIVKRQ